MQPVEISADVQAQEFVAFENFLRNRLFIQAQTISLLRKEVAVRDEEIKALKAEIQEMKNDTLGGET